MPASRRVSPSERFRAQVVELFDSGRELGQILEEAARPGVGLIFQVALEVEVTEFLGRDRYARGERNHEGLRNPPRSRSRAPRARSRWNGQSCGGTPSPSPPGCLGSG